MNKIPFSLSDTGLIIVEVKINLDYYVRMVLDTGCTHSVLHTDNALKAGIDLNKATKTTITTGSGNEKAKEAEVAFFEAFGYYIENFMLTIFDVSIDKNKYEGYLGLDFLSQFKNILIDFENEIITLA
jgi:predicted aspartyl protease